MESIAQRAFSRSLIIFTSAIAMEVSFAMAQTVTGNVLFQLYITVGAVFAVGLMVVRDRDWYAEPKEMMGQATTVAARILALSVLWHAAYYTLAYVSIGGEPASTEQAVKLAIGTAFIVFSLLCVDELVRVIWNRTDDPVVPWWRMI